MSDRPNIQELTGVALNSSSLKSEDTGRRAIDYVGALAGSSDLGSMLAHIKWAGQDHLLAKALDALVNLMWSRRGRPSSDFVSVCRLALDEWSIEICLGCNGKGHIGKKEGVETRKVKCVTCFGYGTLSIKVDISNEISRNATVSCQPCSGRGSIFTPVKTPGKKHQLCVTCGGMGKYARTDAERASAMGLKGGEVDGATSVPMTPAQEFAKKWHKQYQKVVDKLRFLERKTGANVRERLG